MYISEGENVEATLRADHKLLKGRDHLFNFFWYPLMLGA